jgi:hypothetical protein
MLRGVLFFTFFSSLNEIDIISQIEHTDDADDYGRNDNVFWQ